jgi:uncharacterized protein (DUF1778 family)
MDALWNKNNSMTAKRQSKTAHKSISLRMHPRDLSLLKKAALQDKRSLQKFALYHLTEAAKKTLQMSLPVEP